jgi:hypothetical protein
VPTEKEWVQEVSPETYKRSIVIVPKVHVTRFEGSEKRLKLISPTKETFFSPNKINVDRFKNSSPVYLQGILY